MHLQQTKWVVKEKEEDEREDRLWVSILNTANLFLLRHRTVTATYILGWLM